jgi:hypothetical protein
MPIDTAVTAMINEAASAAVAMSSILKIRRLDTVLPVMEDAKPTGPVSSAMIANPLRLSLCRPRVAANAGAGPTRLGPSD